MGREKNEPFIKVIVVVNNYNRIDIVEWIYLNFQLFILLTCLGWSRLGTPRLVGVVGV